MPLRPDMEQGDYLDIIRRRKWMILFFVLILLFGATVYCVVTPDQYKSVVRIRVIPPAVSGGLIRSNVGMSTEDRLLIIRQDILSKYRLLDFINQMGISKMGFNGMSDDAMVRTMRERIGLVVEPDKKSPKPDETTPIDRNILLISFAHENRQVARDGASKLASFLVGENIKNRELVTQETGEFLGSQLEETRKRLELQEEKMKRYKLRFSGELPQQESANLNMLTRLQDQIKNNTEAIARLQDRKVFLESQISNLENSLQKAENLDAWEAAGSVSSEAPGKLFAELAKRRKDLEELTQKYTAIHPAVVQARTEVKKLEAQIEALRQAAKSRKQTPGKGSVDASNLDFGPGSGSVNFEQGEVQRLRQQVASIDLDITAMKRENTNARRTIDEVQHKLERLPQREQELIALTRDYDNLKKAYDELLEKKLQVNISGNLEGKQMVERFQILEPANLPEEPFKPQRWKILGLVLLASLVIGAGGAIVFEMMNPTLRGSKDFKSFFEMPILACLPVIQDDRERHRIAVRRVAVVGGLVSILGAYVVFLTLYGERVQSILQNIRIATGGKF